MGQSNFLVYKDLIELNDTAIVYIVNDDTLVLLIYQTPENMQSVTITTTSLLHTHLGQFNLFEAVGKPYGSKVWKDFFNFVLILSFYLQTGRNIL